MEFGSQEAVAWWPELCGAFWPVAIALLLLTHVMHIYMTPTQPECLASGLLRVYSKRYELTATLDPGTRAAGVQCAITVSFEQLRQQVTTRNTALMTCARKPPRAATRLQATHTLAATHHEPPSASRLQN